MEITSLMGKINLKPSVVLGLSPPQIASISQLNQTGVTVCCAISSDGVLDPHFFDETVDGNNHLQMLQTFVVQLTLLSSISKF